MIDDLSDVCKYLCSVPLVLGSSSDEESRTIHIYFGQTNALSYPYRSICILWSIERTVGRSIGRSVLSQRTLAKIGCVHFKFYYIAVNW